MNFFLFKNNLIIYLLIISYSDLMAFHLLQFIKVHFLIAEYFWINS